MNCSHATFLVIVGTVAIYGLTASAPREKTRPPRVIRRKRSLSPSLVNGGCRVATTSPQTATHARISVALPSTASRHRQAVEPVDSPVLVTSTPPLEHPGQRGER